MQRITWRYPCFFCQRPIHGGRPTILFGTDRPEIKGICHSKCGYDKHSYGHFQMCPPHHLSAEEVSFLVHFYPRLYSLPGGPQPNSALRSCLASLLYNYPGSVADPLAAVRTALEEHELRPLKPPYDGDLEKDLLRVLGQIRRATTEDTQGTEIDFRA